MTKEEAIRMAIAMEDVEEKNAKAEAEQPAKSAHGAEMPNEPREHEYFLPLWRKPILTLIEAADYTGIGRHKLVEISNDDDCDFVLWNGAKRMFKREKLEAFLNNAFSI